MNSHFPKMAADDLDFQRTALFLDVDGTLLDIAATPDRVVVPDGLARDDRPARAPVRRRAGDRHRPHARRPRSAVLSAAHARRRRARRRNALRAGRGRGRNAARAAAELGEQPVARIRRRDARLPGALAENKRYSFTAHYRAAPKAAAPLRAALQSLLERRATDDLELTDTLCAYEIRPSGVNKGEAVRRFLERPPFVGRRPMFVGDDASDEFGFRSVADRRGLAFAVGAARPEVDHVFADPATVRLAVGVARRKSIMCSPIRRRFGCGSSGSPPSRPLRERRDRARRRHGFRADRQLPDRRSH